VSSPAPTPLFADRAGLAADQLRSLAFGYVRLKPLRLHDVYADGLLERIPAAWP
jgi:hypothetical protein